MTSPQYINRMSVYKIAAFIWRNYPPARDWGAEILRNFCGKHMSMRTLAYVTDEDENIVGVGVARLVMQPEDAVHNGVGNFNHDPEGALIWVDLACTTDPAALPLLVCLIRARFGEREKIAYWRNNRIHIRSLDRLRNSVLAKEIMNHGQ